LTWAAVKANKLNIDEPTRFAVLSSLSRYGPSSELGLAHVK